MKTIILALKNHCFTTLTDNICTSNTIVTTFMEKRLTKVSDLVDTSSKTWRSVVDICDQAGFRSVRMVE